MFPTDVIIRVILFSVTFTAGIIGIIWTLCPVTCPACGSKCRRYDRSQKPKRVQYVCPHHGLVK